MGSEFRIERIGYTVLLAGGILGFCAAAFALDMPLIGKVMAIGLYFGSVAAALRVPSIREQLVVLGFWLAGLIGVLVVCRRPLMDFVLLMGPWALGGPCVIELLRISKLDREKG